MLVRSRCPEQSALPRGHRETMVRRPLIVAFAKRSQPVENPGNAQCATTKYLRYLAVTLPSHGRGRRFNPYSAHQPIHCFQSFFAAVHLAEMGNWVQKEA